MLKKIIEHIIKNKDKYIDYLLLTIQIIILLIIIKMCLEMYIDYITEWHDRRAKLEALSNPRRHLHLEARERVLQHAKKLHPEHFK